MVAAPTAQYSQGVSDQSPPELTSKRRRELASDANRLPTAATLDALELEEAGIAHVRQLFAHHALVKVRLQTEDRGVFKLAAQDLAERLPATLVTTIGRIAVYYRPILR